MTANTKHTASTHPADKRASSATETAPTKTVPSKPSATTNSAHNDSANSHSAHADTGTPKMPPSINLDEVDNTVSPAKLTWREDERGNLVPVSDIFGDVYYSLADGLAESRYVFIEQNQLPERFRQLFLSANEQTHQTNHCFTLAELGFGTGLNILATWQLWRQIKEAARVQSAQTGLDTQVSNLGAKQPRLHIISTEKYPLTHTDLSRSLESWKQRDASLTPFITQLLAQYPTLVSGCHRLHLEPDVTLDLWLGDAVLSLQNLSNSHSTPFNQAAVDAWYLDGFAPSCNESLWAQQIFEQVRRLSKPGSTVATFSSAGVVKRGLKAHGFAVKKVKGFGRKREMLTATKLEPEDTELAPTYSAHQPDNQATKASLQHRADYTHTAIIGAGVSGLMAAWSLAQRGIQVTLLDKSAPLAGASGNPRALLAPKMTPLTHVAEHLHSISYLYSQRLYRQLQQPVIEAGNNTASHTLDSAKNQGPYTRIFEPTATLDLLLKANVNVAQIAEYPPQMATTLSVSDAKDISGLKQQALDDNLYLPQAGLLNPQALANRVLAHPNIGFTQACIEQITVIDEAQKRRVSLHSSEQVSIGADAVIIAAAFESKKLDDRIFEFRKIRGQLSWFEPTAEQQKALPKLPLKYGGYCAQFTPSRGDEALNPVSPDIPSFLLGASFVRNDTQTQIRPSEHAINRDKLIGAIPELADILLNQTDASAPTEFAGWQARVGIRAQTPDYHPLVGQIDEHGLIWTLSGMGSKGYAFSPLCAEVLTDMMTGQFVPLPQALLAKLSPQRKSLQKPLK